MERYLCLDIGNKRIGVAVSDPFNSYALPVETYTRINLNKDLEHIAKLVKEKSVSALVCGLPVNFDGTPSVQTERAKFFIGKLQEVLNLKIFSVDERCTTCEAEEILISQGKSREERKSFVDSLAACEILKGFLNDKKGDNNMSEKEKKHHCDCGCEHDDKHECNHEHEHCDCGCENGCDCEEDIIELTADDGKKMKFFFVGTIEYKGKNYSAFEPAEVIEGLTEDDLVIFEVSGDDDETAELLPIEDEALLEEVFNEFCKVIEEDELAEEAEKLEK